jgi:hypothetical protein
MTPNIRTLYYDLYHNRICIQATKLGNAMTDIPLRDHLAQRKQA